MRKIHVLCLLFFMLLITVPISWAGITGKITGQVYDKDTGEPLAGANIVLLGTTLGASSNIDGSYFILNVPPGIYELRASILGFHPVKKTDVVVETDLTTRIDFELFESTIAIDEIIVTAERPLIQKDITARLTVIDNRQIDVLPVDDFSGILASQAGVTADRNGELHVRGGRSGEIAYLVDGVEITDSYSNDIGLLINNDAISEMSVLSGTFNAEYGNVMSGVVNIVTKEGSQKLRGKLEYTSAMINRSPWREKDALAMDKYRVDDLSLYEERSVQDQLNTAGDDLFFTPFIGTFSGFVSGSLPYLPQPILFFLSERHHNEDSYLPFGYNLERDHLAKLTYAFTSDRSGLSALKLNLTWQGSERFYQNYSHTWKYRPDFYRRHKNFTRRWNLNLTHTITPKLFYMLNYAQTERRNTTGVGPDYGFPAEEANRDTDLEFIRPDSTGGMDNIYRHLNATEKMVKLDANFQANAHHLFKFGLAYTDHLDKLRRFEYFKPLPSDPDTFDVFQETQPDEFAAYVQDKIEFPFMIINAGLRLDYLDPHAVRWTDPDSPLSTATEAVEAKWQLSPRLGISHPISERSVLHFSYGHFFQTPAFSQLYDNLFFYEAPETIFDYQFPLIGNPDIEPQKTVAYEVGVKQQLHEHYTLDVSAFYKDIIDLLATDEVRLQAGRSYTTYVNFDYASVQGFEVSLRKRYAANWSFDLNYTYQVAKGNRSTPLTGFYDVIEGQPRATKEYYLDFDQRHSLSFNLALNSPSVFGPRIIGISPLSNWGFNALAQVNSGLPYTPMTDDPTLVVEPNSERQPMTATVDLHAYKTVWVWSQSLEFFTQVTNLFDRRNVRYVYAKTGKPWDSGREGMLSSGEDYEKNPAHVGAPRMVKVGMRVVW